MEQFLDQKDNKWHITMWMVVPTVNVKHGYNFRVHSITNNDGSIIRDPSISNSHYIFGISTKFFGKKVFFNASFDSLEIQNVKSFKFGFCNEQVAWLNNTFVVFENNCPKVINNNDIVEGQALEVKTSDTLEESSLVSVEASINMNELEPTYNYIVSADLMILSNVILDDALAEKKIEVPIVEAKGEPFVAQKDVVQVAKKKLGRKRNKV